jgi:hypothetical protein
MPTPAPPPLFLFVTQTLARVLFALPFVASGLIRGHRHRHPVAGHVGQDVVVVDVDGAVDVRRHLCR